MSAILLSSAASCDRGEDVWNDGLRTCVSGQLSAPLWAN